MYEPAAEDEVIAAPCMVRPEPVRSERAAEVAEAHDRHVVPDALRLHLAHEAVERQVDGVEPGP